MLRDDEMILIIGLVALAILIPFIFYLINLQKLLENISPGNRLMPPANVWLVLIPLFGLVYMFIMNTNISDSLLKEFKERGIPNNEQRPAFNLGLAKCICRISGIIPGIGALGQLGWIVLWIIYWIKINQYLILLQNNPSNSLYNELRNI